MTGNEHDKQHSVEEHPLLAVTDLGRSFDGLWAVRQVNLEIEEGEIVGLIGPNGAGKTTLFNLISRFLPADRGQILFDGERLDLLPPHMATLQGLVRTFQTPRIFSRLSVLENVMYAAPDQIGENPFKALLMPRQVRKQEQSIRDQARELVDYFGLAHLAEEYAGALSGGQRKLLEMARAMMASPKMLLLDEPMAGVNPRLKEDILEYILDLREQGVTFLVVEHDMEMIMKISDRILVMANGEFIASGKPETVRTNPKVIEAYLGKAQ